MKNRLQGFIVGFLTCALLFSSFSFPAKAENGTTSEKPSSRASDYIKNLKNIPSLGIDKLANNYQKDITRGEFAYLSVKLYEYYTGQEILGGIKCFKDTADEWVLKAKRAGLISGHVCQCIYRSQRAIQRTVIRTFQR